MPTVSTQNKTGKKLKKKIESTPNDSMDKINDEIRNREKNKVKIETPLKSDKKNKSNDNNAKVTVVNPNLSDKAQHDYILVCEALENGNQKAYAELMHRYKDSIYFMLLKMVNSRDDADDLTVEAFGKAFKNLQQYTPDYAFSTWLFKIATNNCIDFIRKRKKQLISIDKGIEGEDGTEFSLEIASDGLDPSQSVMKKQKVEMMRDVVEKLKPRYKRLVELRYFQERSYEEIALELDLPLGTVKAQLFRAREFLYQIMKNIHHTV